MLPRNLAELATYRRRLLELGFSRAKVAGCLDFLLDPTAPDSRSKSTYRKMLVALRGRSDPDGPAGETGGAGIVTLAAVAGVLGTMVAAAGRPHLLAVAPIIQDAVNPEDEPDELLNYCCEPPLLLAA